MASNSESSAASAAPGWTPGQVSLLAAICLVLGLAGGYFLPTSKAGEYPRLSFRARFVF
jgi:hypothetical protein